MGSPGRGIIQVRKLNFNLSNRRQLASIFLAALACFIYVTPAYGDQYDDQIAALQQQIKSQQAQANALKAQANTLQNQLNGINAQINEILTQEQLTTAKLDKVAADLAAAQAKMDKEKSSLGENIRLLYQQQGVSSLEVVASSDSLSDFFDKQQYLHSFQDKIQESLKAIDALKKQLAEEQKSLGVLQDQQKSLESSLATQRNGAANLLAQTQGQESSYQQLIASNNAKLSAAVAARAEAIRQGKLKITSGGCGGYPSIWCNARQDSQVDDWGMYNRECVSYVAWKRWDLGLLSQPYYWGNATDWFRYVDHRTNPGHGDIAVWQRGANAWIPYTYEDGSLGAGHVAFVERADAGGFTISQYNFDVGDGPGRFSTMYIQYGSVMSQGVGYISGH